MDLGDLWRLDATAQAALVRAGEVTPAQLVDAAIARIERINPQINAVITPLFDEARAAAQSPSTAAPFAGVPMLLKDATLEVEGTPYYLGTSVLRDAAYRSKRTTEMAHRLRRAGFTFIGKTNVPELSSGITTEPRAFGPTRNPWDLARSSGGSSGGSAAAVAVGLTSIAHGGDATGSLRYPAACCGLVTLKPTRGRLPHATPAGMPDPDGVWVDFVLARSVRDLAGVLDATHGVDGDAPFVAPPMAGSYCDAIERPLAPLRVGLLKSDVMAGIPTDPHCVDAVERAGALLADLGHHVEESHPPALDGLWRDGAAAFVPLATVARRAQIRWLEHAIGREIVAGDLEIPLVTDAEVDAATAQLANEPDVLARRTVPIRDWWESGFDMLVTPTLRQPAWPLGSSLGAIDAGVFPSAFSLTGQPAMSVPLHWTPEGLPIGVQIVAAFGRDDIALAVAAQLEAAAPWRDRWPSLSS